MGHRTKTTNPHIGKRIKNLRTQAKLTQKDLGEILHKNDSTVRMWELEKSEPDNETLCALATFFNTSVDYLLGRKDDFIKINLISTKNDELTKEEEEILEIYRNIDQELQGRALAYMRRLKETAGDEISLVKNRKPLYK